MSVTRGGRADHVMKVKWSGKGFIINGGSFLSADSVFKKQKLHERQVCFAHLYLLGLGTVPGPQAVVDKHLL